MTDRVIQPESTQTSTAPAKRTAEPSGSTQPPREAITGPNKVLRQRMTDAEMRARQLCKLAIELTQDKERDRRDLARVLRDDLQQTLVAAYVWARMAKAKGHGQELKMALETLEDLLTQCLVTLRSLASQLSPQILFESSFVSALTWLASEARNTHGLEVSITADPHVEPSTQEVRSILFRGVKELLFNNVKHADTPTALITVIRDEGHLRVTVDGQGVGFIPDTPADSNGLKMGLFSIRECLTYLGGSLELNHTPGRGSRAVFAIPDDRQQSAPASDESGADGFRGANHYLQTQGLLKGQITARS